MATQQQRMNPDHTVLVRMHDLAAATGGVDDIAGYWLRRLGFEASIVRDWRGRAAVPASVARAVFEAWQAERQENDRRHKAYRAWLDDRREQARQRRAAELAEAAERVRSANTERRRLAAERDLAKHQAEQAEADTKKEPTFEEFLQRHYREGVKS
jgi:hypothetical protein